MPAPCGHRLSVRALSGYGFRISDGPDWSRRIVDRNDLPGLLHGCFDDGPTQG